MFFFGIVATFVVIFVVWPIFVYFIYWKPRQVPQMKPIPINAVIKAPRKLLEAFVTTYKDKIRLEEQWRRLDKRLQQRNITKTTFHNEKQDLDRELSQVEDKVKILRAQLRDKGKYYRDFVDELEINEIQKVTILISMDELTNRYIEEQMSKESFEKIQREYDIKFQIITNHIEKILAGLQETIVLESRK